MKHLTSIPSIYIDWLYDGERLGKYKFPIQREEHGFSVGNNVIVTCLSDGEKHEGRVEEVCDDGIILKVKGWLDTYERYSLDKRFY